MSAGAPCFRHTGEWRAFSAGLFPEGSIPRRRRREISVGVGPGMVPEGLCDQFQPPRPAGLPVLPHLGLEPGYRLPVQGEVHAPDEADLQGLLLSYRPRVGLGEELPSIGVVMGFEPRRQPSAISAARSGSRVSLRACGEPYKQPFPGHLCSHSRSS